MRDKERLIWEITVREKNEGKQSYLYISDLSSRYLLWGRQKHISPEVVELGSQLDVVPHTALEPKEPQFQPGHLIYWLPGANTTLERWQSNYCQSGCLSCWDTGPLWWAILRTRNCYHWGHSHWLSAYGMLILPEIYKLAPSTCGWSGLTYSCHCKG